MSKRISLSSPDAIGAYRERLHRSAGRTCDAIAAALDSSKPLDILYRMKFEALGYDPLNAERALNLVEQLHQTFTYLASLNAAALLFERHPGCGPLILNLGTAPGWDIESESPDIIAAEVFAAVTPDNNRKLSKDISRMANASAEHRYVFFMCPGFAAGPYKGGSTSGGVNVWSLGSAV